jgi:phage-related protein
MDPMKPNKPALLCIFYKTDGGVEPVRVWLRDQPPEVRRKIGDDIWYVQYSWPVGRPRVGALGGGLHEVRTSHFDNDYRVIFSISEGKILLLHAGQKPIPKADVDIALSRKRATDKATAERRKAAAKKKKT